MRDVRGQDTSDKGRPKNGPASRIFASVCFRCIVHEVRGLKWRLPVPSLVFRPIIESIESHTQVSYKPRKEKTRCRAKNHKISEGLALLEVRRSRVLQTPRFVDTFPRLSATQWIGCHFLQVTLS